MSTTATMIDIIILSNCLNHKVFEMNCNCLQSLSESETQIEFNVVIMESSIEFKKQNFQYPKFHNIQLTVHVAPQPFNFSRNFNIGIKKTSNNYIALCNNDIIFKPNWCSEILKFAAETPSALSFCPKNPESRWTKAKKFHQPTKGYNVREEFVGWCYILNRKIFKIIPLLDETFDFYFQDDDFAMTLRKYNINHWMVPSSNVIHLGGETSSITDGFKYNEKAHIDRTKFHKKWGAQRTIAWKNRLFRYIMHPLKLGFVSKHIY